MSRKIYNGLDVVNQKIINLADGTSATDAVNKQQLDAAIRGVTWKTSVRAASTATVTLATPGTTLDGVTLAANDRVLLKNQSAGAENGIYVWTASGSALTRALDADVAAELIGAAVMVTEGTVNANTAWTQNVEPITLNTTALVWAQLGGGLTYIAGNGLGLSGATFSVTADTGIQVTGSGVKIDNSVVVRKYAANIGNGSSTSIAVTHGLGTKDITYSLQIISTGEFVDTDAVATDTNTLTLTFATAPASASLRVVVHA